MLFSVYIKLTCLLSSPSVGAHDCIEEVAETPLLRVSVCDPRH